MLMTYAFRTYFQFADTQTDSYVADLLQALEPHISGEIMNLHHTKHHQAYVNGLNAAEEAYAKTDTPKERIKLQAALKFNGGGAFGFSRVSS